MPRQGAGLLEQMRSNIEADAAELARMARTGYLKRGRGVLIITVGGDIEGNPGPTQANYWTDKLGDPDVDRAVMEYDPDTSFVMMGVRSSDIKDGQVNGAEDSDMMVVKMKGARFADPSEVDGEDPAGMVCLNGTVNRSPELPTRPTNPLARILGAAALRN
jgi:hypothetical protein